MSGKCLLTLNGFLYAVFFKYGVRCILQADSISQSIRRRLALRLFQYKQYFNIPPEVFLCHIVSVSLSLSSFLLDCVDSCPRYDTRVYIYIYIYVTIIMIILIYREYSIRTIIRQMEEKQEHYQQQPLCGIHLLRGSIQLLMYCLIIILIAHPSIIHHQPGNLTSIVYHMYMYMWVILLKNIVLTVICCTNYCCLLPSKNIRQLNGQELCITTALVS